MTSERGTVSSLATQAEAWQRVFWCSLGTPYLIGFACAHQIMGLFMPTAASSVCVATTYPDVDAEAFALGLDFVLGTVETESDTDTESTSGRVLSMPELGQGTSRKYRLIAA